jgi:succinate dehydrogenase hydrophobic anchor subunit
MEEALNGSTNKIYVLLAAMLVSYAITAFVSTKILSNFITDRGTRNSLVSLISVVVVGSVAYGVVKVW